MRCAVIITVDGEVTVGVQLRFFPLSAGFFACDFFAVAKAGNLPAVSFLKAIGAQDGHAGYSSPLDEQTFLVNTINYLQNLKQWDNTAVVISWDDSDGFYDHEPPPFVDWLNKMPSTGIVNEGFPASGGVHEAPVRRKSCQAR